ncbi:MAG: ABC transporter ATP-binding protein [Faecousia sp.]
MAEQNQTPKRKPKYGLFSCVGYIYRFMWEQERHLALTAFFTIPVTLAAAALTLYTPSLILEALETAGRFSYVALVILGLLLAGLLAELANNVITNKLDTAEFYMLQQLMFRHITARRERDWCHQYQEPVQELDERAYNSCKDNHTAAVHFPMDFAGMVATVLNFLLFGGVVSMLSPWIVVLLAAGCLISYAMSVWERKVNYREQDQRNAADKRRIYMTRLSGNPAYAKDIRLYSMNGFLHDRNRTLLGVCQAQREKLEQRSFATAAVSFLVVLVRDALAYGFLIFQAAAGELDAARFVLYFSAITALSGFLTDILNSWGKIVEGALQISDYREDLEIPDRLNHTAGIPVPQGPFSIEFRNVSYQYPMGEKKILDNVSFRIAAGEKIALVGLNGAGKTTLTMLMCGMLLPDKGEVLIDGHSVLEYNRDELYDLFGLVPQNYNLLPISIGRNIACTLTEKEIHREKLWACLETAGLAEKIRSLPMQERTPLYREIYPEATDLSGGEKQKLLLARLLYKNPPCIILDEPTAALDPIAEDRMYQQYNQIAARTTSVFISHRLASTRFCDRIFFLDGARFAEVGTHQELMAAGKKYRELYDIQSKYYQEGGADHGE